MSKVDQLQSLPVSKLGHMLYTTLLFDEPSLEVLQYEEDSSSTPLHVYLVCSGRGLSFMWLFILSIYPH